MSAIERLTVTMPAEMAATLRRNVAGGGYTSTSEIVREAVSEWSRQRENESRNLEALRAAIQTGDDSGPSIPADEVFAEMRQLTVERRSARG